MRNFGEDNVRGYIELMKCQHDKAIALFNVGKLSNHRDHQLTSIWCQAVAEKDRRNLDAMNQLVPEIISQDSDIDDQQMASIAIDQYVLDLRNDRKASNLSCN